MSSCTYRIGLKLKHLKLLQHTQGINYSWLAAVTVESETLCLSLYVVLVVRFPA